MKFKIGLVGTGIMGKPMAINIIKAGYTLSIFARHPEKVKDLSSAGAKILPSVAEVAEQSDVIITVLPDSCDSIEVITGADGIISSAKKGTIVIDMSSIDPIVSKQIARKLSEKDIEFLDAPVSGGEKGAIEGNLAIMVGGKKEVFDKARPIFDVLGSNSTLIGDTGSGNFTKLANQIIVAINLAAVSEAFVLAKKAGLDPDTVFRAIRHGFAQSTVLDVKGPSIIDGDYRPGFKLGLHKKDLQNAVNAANSLSLPLPLTAQVFEILKSLVLKGYGELDHSSIVKYFEEISEIKI